MSLTEISPSNNLVAVLTVCSLLLSSQLPNKIKFMVFGFVIALAALLLGVDYGDDLPLVEKYEEVVLVGA